MARDYAEEYRKRKAAAKARGFESPYKERRAIQTGKARALRPKRIRNEKTWLAQRKYFEPPKPKQPNVKRVKPNSRITPSELRVFQGLGPNQVAEDWSDLFAQTEMATYDPERAKELGITRTEYRNAYIRAFVLGDGSYSTARKRGGSDALYYWFVTLNGYLGAEEYDLRYGIHV